LSKVNPNSPLDKIFSSNFPRTHAFVAISTANIKGNSVEYWMDELKDITIVDKCNCGHCYTIYFEDSKENPI